MTADEFRVWQRGEPDLHELVDGKPVRVSVEKQVTRRIFRLLVAAAKALGSRDAGREWLETQHLELDGLEPWRHAEAGWEGVLRCLRWLADAHPGCTEYDPENAIMRIGAPADLLAEAERHAATERRRRQAGPGLRTFLAIARLWGLDEAERRRALGGTPDVDDWIQAAVEHRLLDLPPDVLERIGAVLAIHQALGVLHTSEREGVEWLTSPHGASVFGGRTPLDLVASGTQEGPLVVLGFLAAARQGVFMEPGELDRHSQPITDDDISIG